MHDYLADHLDWCRLRNLRQSTVEQRRRSLARLRRSIGFDPMAATAADLEGWYLDLAEKVAPEGRATELSHVRQFFRWAQATGARLDDPTVKLLRPRLPRRLPRPASEDVLVTAIDNAPERVRPWLHLAAYAGLRASEIAHLRREHVLDMDKPRMLLVADGKGGKDRLVPMADAVVTALRVHGLVLRGYVFSRGDGRPGPNEPWTISARTNAYLASLDLGVTLHQFRHRFATAVYRECQDLRVVQELLGHASPRTTAQYTGWSMERAVAAVEAAAPRGLRAVR